MRPVGLKWGTDPVFERVPQIASLSANAMHLTQMPHILPGNDGCEVPDTRRYPAIRSEEHTSELQSLMRISYAVFCLKKKNKNEYRNTTQATVTITRHTERTENK